MLELKLFEGLDKITDADVRETISNEIAKGEIVRGDVPTDLQKVFCLAEGQAKRLLNKINEAKKSGNLTEELKLELEAGTAKLELIRSIFWAELRLRLGLNGADIGIRKNWKVVETLPEIPTLLDVIKMIGELANAEDNDCGNPNCPVHGHLHRSDATGRKPEVFAMGRQRRRGES